MPGYNVTVPGLIGLQLISEREYEALKAVVKELLRNTAFGENAFCSVLELGTFDGVTAARLARDVPRIEIVSVDSFVEGNPQECLRKWFVNHDPCTQVLLVGATRNARILGRKFGLVIVDAKHDQLSAFHDLKLAAYLAWGVGVIAAHDYFQPDLPHVEVGRAVDAFCKEFPWYVADVVDSMAFLRRRVETRA